MPTEPSTAPPGLRVTSESLSGVVLQWENVEYSKRNGQITGYNVYLYLNGKLQLTHSTDKAEITSCTVSNLLPCSHIYSASVAAINYAGVGPASNSIPLGYEFPGKAALTKTCL